VPDIAPIPRRQGLSATNIPPEFTYLVQQKVN